MESLEGQSRIHGPSKNPLLENGTWHTDLHTQRTTTITTTPRRCCLRSKDDRVSAPKRRVMACIHCCKYTSLDVSPETWATWTPTVDDWCGPACGPCKAIYIYIYICVYIYMYVCMLLYVCAYLYLCRHLSVCLSSLSIYIFIDLSTCTQTCIYIYKYKGVHKENCWRSRDMSWKYCNILHGILMG